MGSFTLFVHPRDTSFLPHQSLCSPPRPVASSCPNVQSSQAADLIDSSLSEAWAKKKTFQKSIVQSEVSEDAQMCVVLNVMDLYQ